MNVAVDRPDRANRSGRTFARSCKEVIFDPCTILKATGRKASKGPRSTSPNGAYPEDGYQDGGPVEIERGEHVLEVVPKEVCGKKLKIFSFPAPRSPSAA